MYLLADSRAASAMGDTVRAAMASRETGATERRIWLRAIRARLPGHSRTRPTVARVA